MTLQELIPATRLGRARAVMLVFGVIFVLLSVGQLDFSSDVLPVSVLALVAEVGVLLGTAWWQQHVTILEAPATAVLAVLVGISLRNPPAAVGICVGVILTQTLYDHKLGPLLRLVSFVPVLPVSAALSVSADRHQTWNSSQVLAPVAVIPLYVILVVMLKLALESQERSLERSRFLSTMNGRLLAALNPAMVGHILASATDELCELIPGLSGVPVYRGTKHGPAKIFAIHGAQGPGEPREIPSTLLTGLDRLHRFELGELAGRAKPLAALGLPGHRSWYGIPMGLPADVAEATGVDTMLWGIPNSFAERHLGIAASGSTEALELLQTVNRHGQVAFDAAVERIQLLDRTGRDLTTGLPNGDTLMERMIQAVDADGDDCGVVLIGFDGMREITLEHGLNGWGRVTRQLGERITAVQEDLDPDALTARLADNVIAVVLTEQHELTSEVVTVLRERLAEPLLLDETPIRLRITFGVAGPADGSSAFELIDAATMRLLAGPPADHPDVSAEMRPQQA